jgi:hypothetical protein
MVTSGTKALGLCIERAFNVAALLFRLEVSCYFFRQSSDFCKSGIADIAFQQIRGKGQGR